MTLTPEQVFPAVREAWDLTPTPQTSKTINGSVRGYVSDDQLRPYVERVLGLDRFLHLARSVDEVAHDVVALLTRDKFTL
jgi:hypothetical protein